MIRNPAPAWKQATGVIAVTALVSILAIVPFFYIGEDRAVGCCGGEMPVTHDMAMHLNQMQGFYRGLTAGRIYPRWQEETRRGFGAPTTIFYPPAIYYLTSLLYLLLGDWLIVIKVLYLMLMIASGLAFHHLARRFVSLPASIIGVFVYLIAPYHLINHYQRGAIAECLSFILIPVTLAFAWDLLDARRNRLRTAIGLSLCWGVFIISHPPTAYQLALIWGPIGLAYLIWKRRWQAGIWMAAAILIGTMLAGAYILPAIVEQKEIHAEDVNESWPYQESYVFLMNSERYDHRADDFIARIDYIWLANLAVIVIAGMLIAARGQSPFWSAATCRRFCRRRTRKRRQVAALHNENRNSAVVWSWLIAGIYASWMMTVYSQPFGSLVPKIEIGVLSWRLLGVTTLVSAILICLLWENAISAIRSENRWTSMGQAVLAICLTVGLGWMSYSRVIKPMYRAEAFRPIPEHANYSTAPRATPRNLPARESIVFLSGTGKAVIEKWEPEFRQIALRADQSTRVSVRTSNYPGWTARLDGRRVEIESGSLGEILVDVPAGASLLTLEFFNTADRRIGNALTILAAILLGLAVVFEQINRRRRAGDANE